MGRNMMMIAVLILFMFISAMAQGPQQTPKTEPQSKNVAIPAVDQVLDKYVQSVGGRAAVEKLTTRVMKGSLVAPGGTAPLEIYEKAPNKFLVIIDSPVAGISQNGFDGSVAWSQNRQRGLREMGGPEVENFKREYDLHREIRLKEQYPKMTIKGREKVGDREAYVIEATTNEGMTEVIYFDLDTGLMTRRDVTVQGTTLQTFFEDYREVDGVKLPFTIRRSRPNFTFTHKLDEVKHNGAIEDAKFNGPAIP